MRISVFGLGYVGTVSAACLAAEGHDVIGVDKSESKVELLGSGRSPIIEKDIDELIARGRDSGRLRATRDAGEAVCRSELSIVCVGTPSEHNGSLNLAYIRRVCSEIGATLRTLARPHTIVVRSTVIPGTMRSVVVPELERASGGVAGRDFAVCFNPEFLREGAAVHDYRNPTRTVIGEAHEGAAAPLLELYAGLDAPVFCTTLETAEMVKYVDNAWHALKVGFANEIGSICKAHGIDSFEVMDVFCRDTRLNISARYLRPGFAFGGSCLPKDVRALRHRARMLDVEAPILEAILASNEAHVRRGFEMIVRHGRRRIGVLGFSFKAGTDDLRESPVVELIERLIGKGYEVDVYDRNVNLARLTGANRDYILEHVPHIASLMRGDIDEVLCRAETVVVGNAAPEFAAVPQRLRPDQHLVDLVRLAQVPPGAEAAALGERYQGICW